jgi:hypothetical protein
LLPLLQRQYTLQFKIGTLRGNAGATASSPPPSYPGIQLDVVRVTKCWIDDAAFRQGKLDGGSSRCCIISSRRTTANFMRRRHGKLCSTSPPPFAGQENYPRIKRAQTNLAWFNLLAPEFHIEVSQRPVCQPLLCDGLIRVRKGPAEL